MDLLWFLKRLPTIVEKSKVNKKIVVGQWFGKRTIFVDNVSQSGGELVAMWKTVIKELKKRAFFPKKCLVLGVGGGDVIREIRDQYGKISIVGVDVDPVMVDVAKKYFGLKTKSIVIADAFSFIEKQKEKSFDLIVIDLFIGRSNPIKARKKEFLIKVKRLLKENGRVIFNSHYKSREEHEKFTNVCRKVFTNLEQLFSYRLNRVLLLSSSNLLLDKCK